MIRVVENNDWVIYSLLFCGFVYLVMFSWLKGDISLLEFLSQSYNESKNIVLCWGIISFIFGIIISVLLSQYIVIPKFLVNWNINFVLNKIIFIFSVFILSYLYRFILTFIFYKSINQVHRFIFLGFIAQKFYFIFSLFLMALCVVHYYFPIDREEALKYYQIFFILFFLFKNIFYFLNKDKPLPKEWYYKILYICTLQILPLFVVWKFIFHRIF